MLKHYIQGVDLIHINLTKRKEVIMTTIMTELQKAGFISIGSTWADIDGQKEEALLSFYNQVTYTDAQGDTDVSYDLWLAGSEAWKEGYAQAKGCDPKDNKVSAAWLVFTNTLKADYDIVKPAKPSKEGQKKAEQRAKHAEKMKAYEAKTTEELVDEVNMLLKAPSKKTIAQSGKIQAIIDARRKEDLKEVMEDIKAKQNEIKKLVGDVHDHRKLDAILAILNDYDFEIAGL
jgi:transcriptional regulator of NAD metabolism